MTTDKKPMIRFVYVSAVDQSICVSSSYADDMASITKFLSEVKADTQYTPIVVRSMAERDAAKKSLYRLCDRRIVIGFYNNNLGYLSFKDNKWCFTKDMFTAKFFTIMEFNKELIDGIVSDLDSDLDFNPGPWYHNEVELTVLK